MMVYRTIKPSYKIKRFDSSSMNDAKFINYQHQIKAENEKESKKI